MPATVPLSKPLKTHDGETSTLTLRDLSASDIVVMKKSPVEVIRRNEDQSVELLVKYDLCMAYLSRLTGIDDILLGKMSGVDYQVACGAVIDVWNGVGE